MKLFTKLTFFILFPLLSHTMSYRNRDSSSYLKTGIMAACIGTGCHYYIKDQEEASQKTYLLSVCVTILMKNDTDTLLRHLAAATIGAVCGKIVGQLFNEKRDKQRKYVLL